MSEEDEWKMESAGYPNIKWVDANGKVRKMRQILIGVTTYYDENGEWHRADGPARNFSMRLQWYWHGEHIECQSQHEFERIVKMKAFW